MAGILPELRVTIASSNTLPSQVLLPCVKVQRAADEVEFKHPTKPNVVTVAGKPGVDVPIGTLKNIWKQAQIEEKD